MPAKSAAQRAKEYRERVKLDSEKYLHSCINDKIRKRVKRNEMKLPENREQYERYKSRDRRRKEICKVNQIEKENVNVSNKPSTAASFAKSVHRVEKNMPRRKSSKVNVVSKILRTMTPESRTKVLTKSKLLYKSTKRKIAADKQDHQVLAFLEEADISYVCPGRKDTVYIGKNDTGESMYKPKHYLRWTLDEIVSMFNTEKEDDAKVSYYRVNKVASVNKHIKLSSEKPDEDCRCEMCENVDLLLDVISKTLRRENEKSLAKKVPVDAIEFAQTLVCDIHSKKCVLRTDDQCEMCNGFDLEYKDILEFMKTVPEVKLKQWRRIDSKVRKIETTETGSHVVALLKEKVYDKGYLIHVYNIYRQFRELKTLKNKLALDEAIVSVDFARNYDNKQAAEIQSAYFGHDTFTLYTACCYLKDCNGKLESFPLGIVSNEANHDRNVSFSNNMLIIDNLTARNPNLKAVYFWSDGCAKQFRSKYVFKSLLLYPENLKISWDYGEVSHFKGPHDGIGATIKRSVYQAVQQNKVVINTAEEFAKAANLYTEIKVLYMDKTQVKCPDLDDAVAVTGTHKIHHVLRDGKRLLFKKNSPYWFKKEPVFKDLNYQTTKRQSRRLKRKR